MEVNIHEAKTQLSRLLKRVTAGEEVTISRAGVPVAKLVAIASVNGERPLGAMEGQIYMADDFDAPLPDDLFALFNGKELKRKKPTRAKLENRTKSPRPAMRFLLDTSTWLWSVAKVDRLNQVAEDVLRDPQHELYLSAVSVWEIAIKASLGKLHLPEAPRPSSYRGKRRGRE